MEKSKKTLFGKRHKDERGINNIPSCPLWIFGNKKSAAKDLKKRFEVVDEKENQDNDETV